jgi:hypothetical protein
MAKVKDMTKIRRGAFSEYLATGSSREQLNDVIRVIMDADVSPEEKTYLTVEVVPMLLIFFDAAVNARSWHFSSMRQIATLGVIVAIGSMASATELINPAAKWIPLLIVGIISTIKAAIEVGLQVRQPALDWISARTAYDAGLAEAINRLTKTGIYAGLSEEERYVKMTERIDIAFYAAEFRIQQRIANFLETPPTDSKNEDKKDG